MSLSPKEVEGLVKWIEYHLKGYENEQNPQILAIYIKSLILRKTTQQRMVAVLREFMDDKAEDFVNMLEHHLQTRDFTIPENGDDKNRPIPPPKKQAAPIKIKIEEVRPPNLIAKPIVTENTSSKKNTASLFSQKSSSSYSESRSLKDSAISEKHRSKRDTKLSYSSSQPNPTPKRDKHQRNESNYEKEKHRKTLDRDDNIKISKKKYNDRDKYRDKKYSQSKDRNLKKDKHKGSLSYSYDESSYESDEYNEDDYDYISDYGYGYDYDYEYDKDKGKSYDSDYYEYESEPSKNDKVSKRSFSYMNSQYRKRADQPSKFNKNYRYKERDGYQDKEKNSQYYKKRMNAKSYKDYKDSSSQKNKKIEKDSPTNSEKNQNQKDEPPTQNNFVHEPSEVDHEHSYIVAVCGIPPQVNTIGHILKEFNRFGLIHGIQVISEQKMALIEFSELEAAYRAVNSRHHFFHNTTVKVDYAIQIDQQLLDPIAEKIKQKRIISEKKRQEKIQKKQERLLKKQQDMESRKNALEQAAAMAAAAINSPFLNTNIQIPTTNDQNESNLSGDSTILLETDEQLLLEALAKKIAEYESLDVCDRKEQLKKDIFDLSTYFDIIS
ncbi:hypothetical protein M9Y10_011259 [Tritrichomonas musculus]|uniref:RRM domain-containing protein n=1 Tax=Tritrichomonas musculus TaxID=1915356 RepID=A0ABR2IL67_9EUKA